MCPCDNLFAVSRTTCERPSAAPGCSNTEERRQIWWGGYSLQMRTGFRCDRWWREGVARRGRRGARGGWHRHGDCGRAERPVRGGDGRRRHAQSLLTQRLPRGHVGPARAADGGVPSIDALETAGEPLPDGMLLASPANPTGVVMSDDDGKTGDQGATYLYFDVGMT